VSRYGAARGVPEYDTFRTGLTFARVRRDMRGTFKHRRRRSVLGFWHQIKLDMWEEYSGQRLR
jgi:hypothetical protein